MIGSLLVAIARFPFQSGVIIDTLLFCCTQIGAESSS